MGFAWTKDLETGNEMIDRQHKQLINATNELLDACTKSQARSEIQKTLDFLNDYVIKHFSDEEKLQLQYHYPDYDKHKKYHEDFKKVVLNIVEEYKQDGATTSLIVKTNNSIAGWLINHIQKEDVKVAQYIRDQMN